MGLYLCVFASPTADDELEGVEVGGYDDFQALRTTIAERLEGGRWASRFSVLMSHSDCAGEWLPHEAATLESELVTILRELAALPPIRFVPGTWQADAARTAGLEPTSLADAFIDVDGEPLITRLVGLAQVSVAHDRPISFQ